MNPTPKMINLPISTGWKDSCYYFAEGDTTILVSKTLFKVHRSILARDGSTFENMFAADSDNMSRLDATFQQDGGSDENPIELQGDTVDEFRDLLWSMYALPHEIAAATMGESDIVKLCNVARMAHKYHFLTTETWALRALITHLTVQRASLLTHALIQITEVAVLCDDSSLLTDSLLAAVRPKWKALIGEKTDLAVVMDVAGRLGMRDIEGQAYLAMLLAGRHAWIKEPLITRNQFIRLLSGHHNLSYYCDRLPHEPPTLTHHTACRSRAACDMNWAQLWELINARTEFGIGMQALAHDKLDLLGRLMMAMSVMMSFNERRFPMLENHEFASSPCRSAALEATSMLCQQMHENVMDFFVDIGVDSG